MEGSLYRRNMQKSDAKRTCIIEKTLSFSLIGIQAAPVKNLLRIISPHHQLEGVKAEERACQYSDRRLIQLPESGLSASDRFFSDKFRIFQLLITPHTGPGMVPARGSTSCSPMARLSRS